MNRKVLDFVDFDVLSGNGVLHLYHIVHGCAMLALTFGLSCRMDGKLLKQSVIMAVKLDFGRGEGKKPCSCDTKHTPPDNQQLIQRPPNPFPIPQPT